MTFSGALKLTDLNDFITPSQACIKPVEQVVDEDENLLREAGAASTQIQIDSSGAYHEVTSTGTGNADSKGTKTKKLKKAEISLNDCLACSGCITSAESVLITMQSHEEVLNFLASNPPPPSSSHKVPVLSIAPQSLAALSVTLAGSSDAQYPSLRRILQRVRAFCTQELGFSKVYDTTFARHLTLLEHHREFLERKAAGDTALEEKLPMLSSACPGWVCYAEKTHAEMIPFMSRTKSPQQVMGTLVKSWLGKKWHKSPAEVYHVTVMPCYDKKLEASRKDFYDEIYSTRDVDCVLTTGELLLMMQEKGWDLSRPVPDEDNRVEEDDFPELISHPGTSSGSYLHSLIASIADSARQTNESKGPTTTLTTRTIRTSSDYEEYILTETATGRVLFKGAKCYGFKNLQNIVRKVGKEAGVQVGRGVASGRMTSTAARGRRKIASATGDVTDTPGETRGYDYVEVMACPSGCVNGGGQRLPKPSVPTTETRDEEGLVRDWTQDGVSMQGAGDGQVPTASTRWADKEWTNKVEAAYWHDYPTPPVSPPLTPRINALNDPSPPQPIVNGVRSVVGKTVVGHPPAAFLDSQQKAVLLAGTILRDLCGSTTDQASQSSLPLSWNDKLNEEGEAMRRKLFRTQFRAVESDVLGLTVQW
ncbi:Cytosolic Fe-S cluster assembly factor nar1 [Tulasnella sp. 418]|nr:Cytosolic Fe-S cluster assembly factor nar1 [Tulasnella sp. 418]